LYWDAFASEPIDFPNGNLELDKVTSYCAPFLAQDANIHAIAVELATRKSFSFGIISKYCHRSVQTSLQSVCSVEGLSNPVHTSPSFLQQVAKVTVILPEPNGEGQKCNLRPDSGRDNGSDDNDTILEGGVVLQTKTQILSIEK
jgi:hypothetical protein